LIGCTPLVLFDPGRISPVPYRAGDAIRFRPISTNTFFRLAGEANR